MLKHFTFAGYKRRDPKHPYDFDAVLLQAPGGPLLQLSPVPLPPSALISNDVASPNANGRTPSGKRLPPPPLQIVSGKPVAPKPLFTHLPPPPPPPRLFQRKTPAAAAPSDAAKAPTAPSNSAKPAVAINGKAAAHTLYAELPPEVKLTYVLSSSSSAWSEGAEDEEEEHSEPEGSALKGKPQGCLLPGESADRLGCVASQTAVENTVGRGKSSDDGSTRSSTNSEGCSELSSAHDRTPVPHLADVIPAASEANAPAKADHAAGLGSSTGGNDRTGDCPSSSTHPRQLQRSPAQLHRPLPPHGRVLQLLPSFWRHAELRDVMVAGVDSDGRSTSSTTTAGGSPAMWVPPSLRTLVVLGYDNSGYMYLQPFHPQDTTSQTPTPTPPAFSTGSTKTVAESKEESGDASSLAKAASGADYAHDTADSSSSAAAAASAVILLPIHSSLLQPHALADVTDDILSGEAPVRSLAGARFAQVPVLGSLTAGAVLLSPPLRTDGLRARFAVDPRTIYYLSTGARTVMFVGIGWDGAPWVCSTRTAPPQGSVPAVDEVEGFGDPLPLCRTAAALIERYGLCEPVKETQAIDTSAVAAQGEEVVLGFVPRKQPVVPPSSSSTPSPPPPMPAPAASAAPEAATAATSTGLAVTSAKLVDATVFIREGDRVSVPGPFGMLLHCDANADALSSRFRVSHGDRLQERQTAGDNRRTVTVMGVSVGALVVLFDGEERATLWRDVANAEELDAKCERLAGAQDTVSNVDMKSSRSSGGDDNVKRDAPILPVDARSSDEDAEVFPGSGRDGEHPPEGIEVEAREGECDDDGKGQEDEEEDGIVEFTAGSKKRIDAVEATVAAAEAASAAEQEGGAGESTESTAEDAVDLPRRTDASAPTPSVLSRGSELLHSRSEGLPEPLPHIGLTENGHLIPSLHPQSLSHSHDETQDRQHQHHCRGYHPSEDENRVVIDYNKDPSLAPTSLDRAASVEERSEDDDADARGHSQTIQEEGNKCNASESARATHARDGGTTSSAEADDAIIATGDTGKNDDGAAAAHDNEESVSPTAGSVRSPSHTADTEQFADSGTRGVGASGAPGRGLDTQPENPLGYQHPYSRAAVPPAALSTWGNEAPAMVTVRKNEEEIERSEVVPTENSAPHGTHSHPIASPPICVPPVGLPVALTGESEGAVAAAAAGIHPVMRPTCVAEPVTNAQPTPSRLPSDSFPRGPVMDYHHHPPPPLPDGGKSRPSGGHEGEGGSMNGHFWNRLGSAGSASMPSVGPDMTAFTPSTSAPRVDAVTQLPESNQASAPRFITYSSSSLSAAARKAHASPSPVGPATAALTTARPRSGFTDFLKAYSLYRQAEERNAKGGVNTTAAAGASSRYGNDGSDCAPHRYSETEGDDDESKYRVGIESIQAYYATNSLEKVMAAQAALRRCRDLWRATMRTLQGTRVTLGASPGLQASAGYTDFSHLCVDEVVEFLRANEEYIFRP